MSKITALLQYVPKRSISLSAPCESKRNFRKFQLFNKRGSRLFKQAQAKKPDPEIPIDKRGCRDNGFLINGRFVQVPEMIPELVVPDLKGCDLRPYVSYRALDVVQTEFTAQQLFEVTYAHKIREDYKNGKLDEEGNPLEPSPEEKMTPEEALLKARQVGCDIFEKKREEWVREREERNRLKFEEHCAKLRSK